MTSITLPDDLEAWARAEVAAGRAESVEKLVAQTLREGRQMRTFVRQSLDEARAIGGGAPLADVIDELDVWIAEDEAATKAAE